MSGRATRYLSLDRWPLEDRRRWEAAFEKGDFLDEAGVGAHLAPKSRADLKAAYSLWLGYLNLRHSALLASEPAERINRNLISQYVTYMREFYQERSVVISLHHLRLALRLLCPGNDWRWLLNITKRIAAQSPAKSEKHHVITSDRLYALGLSLMDEALAVPSTNMLPQDIAQLYRDGLMIALLAAIPLRRRTFAALQIGKQLVRSGNLWALDIPAEDVKTRRPLEFSISADLSGRLDQYLLRFRKELLSAQQHEYLWVGGKGKPMRGDSIFEAIKRRTHSEFGFAISMHRFRHAAATLWSVHDAKNVRGAKDLLGHASFGTTEKHYNISQSRIAGRRFALILNNAAKR